MKIIVTIIPTNLVANSLLSFFLGFHRNQKQETNFQQVGGLVCVFLFLRPSTVKASSVWISWIPAGIPAGIPENRSTILC